MILTINIVDIAGSPLLADVTVGVDTVTGVSQVVTDPLIDNSSIDIAVAISGYNTYNMTIDDLYMADKTIAIQMSPVVMDTNNANYNKPFPIHFFFEDECSFKVDYYSATNEKYDTSWYLGNGKVANGSKYTKTYSSPGVYTVKIRQESFDYVEVNETTVKIDRWDQIWGNSTTGVVGNTVARDTESDVQVYLDLDTIANTTVEEYRPTLTLSVSDSTPSLAGEDDEAYPRKSLMTVQPTWEINRGIADDYNIEFKVISPTGINIALPQSLFPLAIGAENVSISFNLDELGQYTVEAEIIDLVCDTRFPQELIIETSNFILVEPDIDCNVFHVRNRSIDRDIVVSIGDFENNQVDTYTSFVKIEAGGSFTYTLPTGMFIISATYTDDGRDYEESYVVGNYCAISNCLTSYIQNVLCAPAGCKCDYDVSEELAAMRQLTLQQGYFMYLTKTFKLNDFFTSLTDSVMADIYSAQSMLDKLVEYCDRIQCIDGDCAGCKDTGIPTNITQNGTGGCGCS